MLSYFYPDTSEFGHTSSDKKGSWIVFFCNTDTVSFITYTETFFFLIKVRTPSIYVSITKIGWDVSGLLEVVNLSAPDCQKNYEEMITEQKRLYSQSWVPVLEHIWSADTDIPTAILMAPGKLADKYCRIIKVKKPFLRDREVYCIPTVGNFSPFRQFPTSKRNASTVTGTVPCVIVLPLVYWRCLPVHSF
jgi:hypothetical protein